MGRYVDADALIMALRLEYPMMPMFKENQKEWEIKTDGYRKAEEVIRNAPTIDAIPIEQYRSMENTCYKLQKALEEMADRKTESNSEKPNNCDTCKIGKTECGQKQS